MPCSGAPAVLPRLSGGCGSLRPKNIGTSTDQCRVVIVESEAGKSRIFLLGRALATDYWLHRLLSLSCSAVHGVSGTSSSASKSSSASRLASEAVAYGVKKDVTGPRCAAGVCACDVSSLSSSSAMPSTTAHRRAAFTCVGAGALNDGSSARRCRGVGGASGTMGDRSSGSGAIVAYDALSTLLKDASAST